LSKNALILLAVDIHSVARKNIHSIKATNTLELCDDNTESLPLLGNGIKPSGAHESFVSSVPSTSSPGPKR
jgi:hypothetical protein